MEGLYRRDLRKIRIGEKQKNPRKHFTAPGIFLLLGEDKYYLSLAYYHCCLFFEAYTCNKKIFKKFHPPHLKEI